MHLITRPSPDIEPFKSQVEALGCRVLVDSVFDICLEKPERLPNLIGTQGLLMTSANGVRAFAAVSNCRDLCVYAVGASTAEEAKKQGFKNIKTAGGNVRKLALLVAQEASPDKGWFLHSASSELAGDLGRDLRARGYDYRKAVLYRTVVAQALKEETISSLIAGKISSISFFSPRSARIFCQKAQESEVERLLEKISVCCLSHAVAQQALSVIKFADCRVAEVPQREALLQTIPLDDGK